MQEDASCKDPVSSESELETHEDTSEDPPTCFTNLDWEPAELDWESKEPLEQQSSEVRSRESWLEIQQRCSEPGFIVSQNVNGCDHATLLRVLAALIEPFKPGIILLQGVCVSNRHETKLRKLIKLNWGYYRIFMAHGKPTKANGYIDFRLATLVHAALAPAPVMRSPTMLFPHRILSVRVGKAIITNVHQFPTRNAIREREKFFRSLLEFSLATTQLHFIGGDFNASTFSTDTVVRRRLVESPATTRSDPSMAKFLADLGADRRVMCEESSIEDNYFSDSFRPWKWGIEAKLYAFLAISPPGADEHHNIVLTFQTFHAGVASAYLQHRAIAVQVDTQFSDALQVIPKLDLIHFNSPATSRRRNTRGSGKVQRTALTCSSVRDPKAWGEQQVNVMILDAEDSAGRHAKEGCSNEEPMEPQRGMSELSLGRELAELSRTTTSSRTELDSSEAELQLEMRSKIERFEAACMEEDQEFFNRICNQQQARLGAVDNRISDATEREEDLVPKEPFMCHVESKHQPNTIRCSGQELRRVVHEVTEEAEDVCRWIEEILSRPGKMALGTFRSADQQILMGVERNAAHEHEKFTLSFLPADHMLSAVQALIEMAESNWEVGGYRDLTGYLPMEQVGERGGADQTISFIAVSASTKQGGSDDGQDTSSTLTLEEQEQETNFSSFCAKCPSEGSMAGHQPTTTSFLTPLE
ncbi:hypothetical protein GUITHDRAFT_113960 [Guillardia theta CCMP2712]|uniref:Endonuclease/exonuclease/phosphatase domain-containing protein n=1 Tax=Guillardia theta (strain CCMP2712) TaxID=905079 RepID=L1IUQ7_GUITC|nr:hypothetical protein GUITHDRAFT_113960 [Guillardia theta CCMP2712]EKX39968.1 hypothetical protein GUITHDRAFT_113960 [Guillardia theta CCMP2712]|mmetsp:Transcript_30826/g.99108  ORF Transcript_30826/g.99108 Transcript_30826/m.99108 type:complete len:700 (-) Transcript_30826:945-3044(-)|eukprot:XP_005826948.1 hypothetical protein GUITHDRAFT_113960 [Guillardia theta CCMP2712]